MNATNGKANVKRSVVSGVGEVVSDISSLAELQFRLFALDSKASGRKLVVPLVLTVIGLLLLAGCFPVALISIAYVLHQFAELPLSAATGIALGMGLVVAVTMTVIGLTGLKHSFKYFDRTITELKRNVDWLKRLRSKTDDKALTRAERQSINQ